MRVVIVDNDLELLDSFVRALTAERFDVEGVVSGEEMDSAIGSSRTDLLVLDVGLPGESGCSISKRVRLAMPEMRIFMLSNQTSLEDRLLGYECGADAYFCKPMHVDEFLMLVRAVKRRLELETIAKAGVVLHMPSLSMKSGADQVELTEADATLLGSLALAAGNRLPYWRLYEITKRKEGDPLAQKQLELQVCRLRKKMRRLGLDDDFIKAVRGDGYQLSRSVRVVY